MLKKFSMLMLAVVLPMIFAATTAGASQSGGHKPCAHLGYCAPGTCADNGSNLACNTKNCKKSNCRG